MMITTGMIALVIGFGYWWIYFDVVGRRVPRSDDTAVVNWMLSHLPITLSIAASGAAIVSLIGHAGDARTPASTAWLLSGAVALGLLALVVTARALADAERLAVVYRPLTGRSSAERLPQSWSAGFARRRGCWPCRWWRSFRFSGCSPSSDSSVPTPGTDERSPARHGRRSRPSRTTRHRRRSRRRHRRTLDHLDHLDHLDQPPFGSRSTKTLQLQRALLSRVMKSPVVRAARARISGAAHISSA